MRKIIFTLLSVSVVFLILPFGISAQEASQKHEKHMVVAANPHAAAAGLEMLKAGGSAVDAAIAVELVLSLVEPQSSGIGGGGFMMHYDAGAKKGARLSAYDGREMAPAAVGPDLFMDVIKGGSSFRDAVLGGRSVGTPSVVAMLHMAHQRHGKLPWKDVFAPALRLAKGGFKVSPRLHFLLARDPLLKKIPTSRAYFYNAAGEAWPVGHLLKNPDYAQSLKLIAEQGPDVFYKGELAKKIVDMVQFAPSNPGKLTLADMAAYMPKQRKRICGPYRVWTVCGMPPPSSGGVAVLSILGMLQSFDLGSLEPNSEQAVHLILEAERLGYADRSHYVADSDYVSVPLKGLLDPSYLRNRARLINKDHSMGRGEPGVPPMQTNLAYASDDTREIPSTSHFSIIDQWGNMVAMTATVENAFGSRLMVGGFMLNNQLTDFSFIPERNGLPTANRVEGGKRPRSSMSPTFVFDAKGRPVMAIGSPGGNSIIAYVTQSIINVLDWKMTLQEAINQPHFLARKGIVILERDTAVSALAAPLERRGHDVKLRNTTSGLHGFIIHYDAAGKPWYEGGADHRREGVVLAE